MPNLELPASQQEILNDVHDNTSGGLDVNVQDQTSAPVIVNFNRIDFSTTLTVATAVDDLEINVADPAEVATGDYLIIFSPETGRFYKGTALSGTTNPITVDTPLDSAFPVGSFCDITETNMAVDGSVTTQTFGLRGVSPEPIGDAVDITRIIFTCTTDNAVDLSKFGDIVGGITNGLVCRVRNGDNFNVFNVKTNQDLASLMYDFNVQTATNPAQGQDGFVARLTFGGQSKLGVVIRLDPGFDLEFLIQDDLSDLITFTVVGEGHFVEEGV